ncbi:BsuPI-related putative proteinase inhibitor [Salinirubellus sp. GCM10025818]|uniref:BsuPI-related putative proteinase inhibitor n=1 Tax=Salinirubellus TaxID=2162630 RepID=UPI0030D0057B
MLDSSLEVTVGEGVSFRFTVSNGTGAPVELTFRDACRADFTVRHADEEVWRWSEGRMFTQDIGHARLEPGEEAVFEEEWPDPDPGDYTAEATLRVDEYDVRAETPFSV